ncbi:MAG: hypothetical protein V3U11_02555, partial [Planctomycetota bacterium]
MSCAYGHIVIAVCLDGDSDHEGGDQLLRHLSACLDCQQALRQARLLDAALATSSGVAVDDALAERLLRPVCAGPEPVPAGAGLRLRPVPLLLGAAALVLLGAALVLFGVGTGYLRIGEPPQDQRPSVSQEPPTAAPEDVIPLPELPNGAGA